MMKRESLLCKEKSYQTNKFTLYAINATTKTKFINIKVLKQIAKPKYYVIKGKINKNGKLPK